MTLGLGDSVATPPPSLTPPPPLPMHGPGLAAAGDVAMCTTQVYYGPVAASSAPLPSKPCAMGGPAVVPIWMEEKVSPAYRRTKESGSNMNHNPFAKDCVGMGGAYLWIPRSMAMLLPKACDPPDRDPADRRLLQMRRAEARGTHVPPVKITPGVSVAYLEAGGGAYGAPSVDAARPKPAERESVAPMVMIPYAFVVVAATQGLVEAHAAMQDDGMKPELYGLHLANMCHVYNYVQQMGAQFLASDHGKTVCNHSRTRKKKASAPARETWKLCFVLYAVDLMEGMLWQMEDGADSRVCEVVKEATGPGAAGVLTGPCVLPRQEP